MSIWNTIFGTDDDDNIIGTNGNDWILAGAGNDFIDAGKGDDLIEGEDGDDTIIAGSGNDIVFGGSGNDSIWGRGGNDVLYDGAGNDVIRGNGGNDTFHYDADINLGYHDFLHGGSGFDTLNITITQTTLDSLTLVNSAQDIVDYFYDTMSKSKVNFLDIGLDLMTKKIEAINVDVTPYPDLAITQLDAVKSEGDSGLTSFTFTVTRTGDLSNTSATQYDVTGTGANPADLNDFAGVLPSGVVNFAIGESSQVISIDVSGDTLAEADEGFSVSLSNPMNANITVSSQDGLIQNDDTTVLARAWIDTDYDHLYTEGSDILSVEVLDSDGSGTVTAGDVVNFGSVALATHSNSEIGTFQAYDFKIAASATNTSKSGTVQSLNASTSFEIDINVDIDGDGTTTGPVNVQLNEISALEETFDELTITGNGTEYHIEDYYFETNFGAQYGGFILATDLISNTSGPDVNLSGEGDFANYLAVVDDFFLDVEILSTPDANDVLARAWIDSNFNHAYDNPTDDILAIEIIDAQTSGAGNDVVSVGDIIIFGSVPLSTHSATSQSIPGTYEAYDFKIAAGANTSKSGVIHSLNTSSFGVDVNVDIDGDGTSNGPVTVQLLDALNDEKLIFSGNGNDYSASDLSTDLAPLYLGATIEATLISNTSAPDITNGIDMDLAVFDNADPETGVTADDYYIDVDILF